MQWPVEIILSVMIGFMLRIIYEKIFYGNGSIELIPAKQENPEDYPYVLKINTNFKELEKRKRFIFAVTKR